jgi:hypothetical protein
MTSQTSRDQTPTRPLIYDIADAAQEAISLGLDFVDGGSISANRVFGNMDGIFSLGAGLFADYSSKVIDSSGISAERAISLALGGKGSSKTSMPHPPMHGKEPGLALKNGHSSFNIFGGVQDYIESPVHYTNANSTGLRSGVSQKFKWNTTGGIKCKGEHGLTTIDEARDNVQEFMMLQTGYDFSSAEEMPWYLFVAKPVFATAFLQLVCGPLLTVGNSASHYSVLPARKGNWSQLPALVVKFVFEKALCRQLESANELHHFWCEFRGVDDLALAGKVFSEFEDARELVNRFTGKTHHDIAKCDDFKRVSAYLDLEVQREALAGVKADEDASSLSLSPVLEAASVPVTGGTGGGNGGSELAATSC